MSLSIRKITDANNDTLNMMTNWMYDWWGAEEKYSYEAVKCYMKHSFGEDRLPQTYGFYLDEKMIGMYQFTHEDLFVRPDIYPWLANVYLDEPYRKSGYGRIMLQSVKNNARDSLKYDELFLFTKHIGLYEKYGWKFVSEIDTFLGESRIERLYKLDIW